MPRIFGTGLWVVALATLAFFMLGWLWYDPLFGDQWMALAGLTEEEALENMGRSMGIGVGLSLLQALGLAGIMKLASGYSVGKGLKVGFLAWLLFALPVTAYSWNYAGSPFELFKIDIVDTCSSAIFSWA